ncbi:uncharacterized protein LOC121736262 [Aricia agestis]|uniref:uncharacterized protein LOC121736262 n=1 Tax=Aricia agestis TaxID=91739 RepID=UPI001C202588|nr:uncharacterized protein LOC121736262 [Aricia agestis]
MRKIPTSDEVRITIRRWFNPTALDAGRLRDVLVGVVMTVGLAEACIFRLLHHHIAAGELPPYITDVLIVVYLMLEACVSPLVSWWGYRARRRQLLTWSATLTACLAAWFLLRTPAEVDTGLCVTSTPESRYSAARLVILLLAAPVLVAARAAVWCHGLAYIEDHAPDRTPVQFSAFVLSRVLPLVAGVGMTASLVDSNLPVQVAFFVMGMVLHVVLLMTVVPKQDPKVKGVVKSPPPMNDRGFTASVCRVVRNPLLTSQVLAISLLAAALWTYGYYRNDVIKVKYNMAVRSNISNFTETLQYSFVILVVVFQSTRLSPPLLARWSNTKGVKQALMPAVLALVMIMMMMFMSDCDPGTMVMEPRNCSLECGCADRYVAFSPVCMLDDLTTYPSPCLAGCSTQEVVDGLSLYVNCTCGDRAVSGTCGADRCSAAFELHQMLFVVIVAAAISAMATHGAVAVRAADARDRAVALGVGCAVVAAVVAVTHTYLAVVTSNMCALFAGGVCVVPSAGLPQLVGISSAVLLALSCLVSTIVCLRLWRTKRTDTEL